VAEGKVAANLIGSLTTSSRHERQSYEIQRFSDRPPTMKSGQHEIDDAGGSCPTSLGLDVGRLFDGSSADVTRLTPNWALRVCGTRLPREERTGPARERQCSAIIVPLRCFSQRPSSAISPRWSATRCDHKARPRSSAHRVAASGGRALGHGLARGFRFGRDVALVTQT
jgi:hypothetical protein